MDGPNFPMPGLLTRERIVAQAGYNRWLVPPAALAVHLSIGMVYGLSVFWLPLSQAIGITHSVACARPSLMNALFTTECDWTLGDLKPIFTLAIVVLGASAAIWGGWLERAGPRKAGLVAAVCWPGGLALTALGVHLHQLWLLWLGGGVIGGIGLGLGYISPVSTLIAWFPDRRGLATGLAIMGFGGGAMIGAPLAAKLMAAFRTPTDVGAAPALLVMAVIYAVFLTGGAFLYRVTPGGAAPSRGVAVGPSVSVRDAHKTPQFWLLWAVLCLNVSAGIGVLEMASPMLQEIFGGRLIGAPGVGFASLSPDQHKVLAGVGAGFIGFLSLFNILGAVLLGVVVRSVGAAADFFDFLPVGSGGLCRRAEPGAWRAFGAVRRGHGACLVDVWRRVRDDSGVFGRSVRAGECGRHSWTVADRMVGGGADRAGDRQRFAAIAIGRGREAGEYLRQCVAGAGGAAGGGAGVQPGGAAGGAAVVHAGAEGGGAGGDCGGGFGRGERGCVVAVAGRGAAAAVGIVADLAEGGRAVSVTGALRTPRLPFRRDKEILPRRHEGHEEVTRHEESGQGYRVQRKRRQAVLF